jgi:hypothetical protein
LWGLRTGELIYKIAKFREFVNLNIPFRVKTLKGFNPFYPKKNLNSGYIFE